MTVSRCSGLGLSRSLDQCRVWGYILGEDRNIQHLLYRNVYEGFEILHPTAFDSFSSLCSAFRTRRLLLWTLILAEREHPRVCSCSSEHILLFRLDNTCVIYIDNTYRYIVSRYIVLSVQITNDNTCVIYIHVNSIVLAIQLYSENSCPRIS